jgi:adenylate cyclase
MLEKQRTSDSSRRDEALRLVENIGPDFEALLTYVWRRHLLAAISRVESLGEAEDEQVAEATVGFADLVSFSELTNRLGDDEIGDLVEVFESRCHDVVARHGGRMVKTLGDSVLFMASTPADGVEIAWDIVQVIGGDQRLPDVRLGLVTGAVVLRMGDVYGPAVNLAARLVGVARRNRVITDARTADRLPEHLYDTRVLPARPVRGFGDLEPVAVRRTPR